MLRKIAEYVKKIFRMEPIPTTVNTLREALRDLEVARNHFENCDPEFVDAAIFELNAAECRVDAVRRCVGRSCIRRPISAGTVNENSTANIIIVV